MQKGKKVILFSTLVLSLLGLFMIYWERKIPVRETLPQSPCTRVQVYGFFQDEHVEFTPKEDAPEWILSAMEGPFTQRSSAKNSKTPSTASAAVYKI